MNPAVPSARSLPPKPWRTCGRSCAPGRRAPDCRVARPSGSGTTGGDARGARVPARPRARAARRCARDGEDAAGTHPGARPRRQIPAHPVHARFDARRHHRSHAAQRRAGIHLPAGAGWGRSRAAAGAVGVEPQIAAYITAVVRGTREAASLTLGASPRAGVSLLKAARAVALLDGRDYVIPDDVKGLAPAVLRHRVNVAPELELEGVTPDAALKAILDKTEVPTT